MSAVDSQTRWLSLSVTQRIAVTWHHVPEFIGITTDVVYSSPHITHDRENRTITMEFDNGTLVWEVHRDDLDFGREMALELVRVEV